MAEFAFDTPIVWQIQLPPLRIIETRVLRARDIAKTKAPVLTEGDCSSGTRVGEADRCGKQEQETRSRRFVSGS
ncbi:MAG TPA: hypothetical protein VF075_02925 [Pyrinomonadaceae bacterium]